MSIFDFILENYILIRVLKVKVKYICHIKKPKLCSIVAAGYSRKVGFHFLYYVLILLLWYHNTEGEPLNKIEMRN